MKAVLFALLCVFVACVVAAPRPNPSETFAAGTRVTVHLRNSTHHGHGLVVCDEPEGRKLETYTMEEKTHQHLNVRLLDRFDLHKSYTVTNDHGCHEFPETGKMPAVWDWLKNATYEGQRHIENEVLDVWGYKAGHGRVAVAVSEHDPNRPVHFFMDGPEKNVSVRFLSWNTHKPDEKFFDVPKQCQHNSTVTVNPADVGCVDRPGMLARGYSWVKINVPYSQAHTYQGYREDCSGFVSMCWASAKPGHTTSTMHEIAHPIAKAELQPGDIMLCAGDHVVLFVKWTSAAQNEYVYYAETTYGEGCKEKTAVYPYVYNKSCFKPYRYNLVC